MTSTRLRNLANWLNLSTPLGLAIARVGGASVTRGPRDLYVAGDYRWRFPPAGAFTVGSVVVSRHPTTWLTDRAALLAHEERHSWQYVACLGLPFVPLYLLAAAYSRWRSGGWATANVFERLAGLESGGYAASTGARVKTASLEAPS